MRLIVLQHAECEPPGAFTDVFEERGVEVRTAKPYRGDALPDWTWADGIVAMGGPMSVTDAGQIPWLAAEIALVRDAVHAGLPFMGVCLGAQVLAAGLGAAVYVGDRPEVGVAEVQLTPEGTQDPVLSALPPTVRALHWHSDTFPVPVGGVHLARSQRYDSQAFRWGCAYGLQFHLEVTVELCREWGEIPEYALSATAALGAGGLARIDDEMRETAAELNAHSRALIERWLDLCLNGT
jgi:GMP synthase (glutamine-hydrolysing)